MGKALKVNRGGGGLVVKELDIQTLTFIPTKYYTDSLGNNLVAFNIFQLPTGITWKDVLVMEVRRGSGRYFAKLNSGSSAAFDIESARTFITVPIDPNETKISMGGSAAEQKTAYTGRIIIAG